MDGLQRCVRYAFGPNRLHLCGPEANKEVLSYITEQSPDKGLVLLLKQFKTMYPYLQKIAEANKIKDPFDDKVVEAYWLGNELLENIGKKNFYEHLIETQVDKKLSPKEFKILRDKLGGSPPHQTRISASSAGFKQSLFGVGARMHHTFHVYNIWKKKQDFMELKTYDDVDHCRVSWGKIIKIDGPALTVKTQSLVFSEPAGFTFGSEYDKIIHRKLHDDFMEEVKPGDMISIHWDQPCEILTNRQVKYLEKYTRMSTRFANNDRA
ncbi:MAG: DUF6390 family protein [Minisyncoccia bacterium]|jgi:hypothetical protein